MKWEWQTDKTVRKFRVKPGPSGDAGWFDPTQGLIFIDDTLCDTEKEIIYFHEDTHRDCLITKCHCWNKSMLCEYHAYRGELDRVLSSGKAALERYYLLRCLDFMVHNIDKAYSKDHVTAMRKVLRLKRFRALAKKHRLLLKFRRVTRNG